MYDLYKTCIQNEKLFFDTYITYFIKSKFPCVKNETSAAYVRNVNVLS